MHAPPASKRQRSRVFDLGGSPGVTRSRPRNVVHACVRFESFSSTKAFRVSKLWNLQKLWNFQEADHASRRRPGRRVGWWRSAMELRMCGLPDGTERTPRASEHPSLDRG